jgi:cell division protein FtsL
MYWGFELTEEEINRIEKDKRDIETVKAEFRAKLEGMKSATLNPNEKDFLTILESIVNGFITILEGLLSSKQEQLRMTQNFNSLESRIKTIEQEITALKNSLDTLYQNR